MASDNSAIRYVSKAFRIYKSKNTAGAFVDATGVHPQVAKTHLESYPAACPQLCVTLLLLYCCYWSCYVCKENLLVAPTMRENNVWRHIARDEFTQRDFEGSVSPRITLNIEQSHCLASKNALLFVECSAEELTRLKPESCPADLKLSTLVLQADWAATHGGLSCL